MKKFFKIAGIVAGSLFLLLIITLGIVLYNLPSAQEIGQFFKPESPKVIEDKKIKKANGIVEIEKKSEATEHNSSMEDVPQKKSTKFGEEIKSLIENPEPVSQFCKKLNLARSGQLKIFESLSMQEGDHKTLTDEDFEKFESEDFKDLRLEAIRPVIMEIILKPEMNKLIKMAVELESMGSEKKKEIQESNSFLGKAQFYAQAYQVYNEMKDNKSSFEDVMDRTYLMYKLNDLLALKPELQDDPRILRYCEENELKLNSQSPVNFVNEKQNFEKLLSDLDVKPQQIKYNPNYKSKLHFEFSKNSLQLGGGWLEELVPISAKQ